MQAPKKKHRGQHEIHSLNTNVSVLKSLQWEPHRAIRELLLNCFDEDLCAEVVSIDGGVCLKNSVHAGSKTLRKKNFGYAANSEKVDERMKNGKFGYGLKDAVVLLTAYHIHYKAVSTEGTFDAQADSNGNVSVRIDYHACCETGVEQILTVGEGCNLTAKQLRKEVTKAQKQCIAYRVLHEYADHSAIEIKDPSTSDPLGTVYLSPSIEDADDDHEGSTEIFVHGCAYPFVHGEQEKPPLALIYNLHMHKDTIQGRDRVGLPREWQHALRSLIKEVPEQVLSKLLELRRTHSSKFYEFGNQHLNNYINAFQEQCRKRDQRVLDEAERARAAAARAVETHANTEKQVKDLEAEQAAGADEEPAIVKKDRDEELAKLKKEQAKQAKEAEKLRIAAAERKAAANAAARAALPSVLLFHDDQLPKDSGVTPIVIKSTNNPEWIKGLIPTWEEHKLMTKERVQPIDRVHTSLFRQLRRLLYVMRLQDKVFLDEHDGSMPATTLVALRGTILHVRFGGSKDAVIRATILELCSAKLYRGLAGRDLADAVAKLSHLMLQLVPEESKELASKSSSALVTQYLGQLKQTLGSSNSFCPLIVADEWDTKRGGISSFNIQMARGLAKELQPAGSATVHPVVFVVLIGTDAQSDDTHKVWEHEASATGIIIVEASRLRGQYQPCLSSDQFARISHVVGHAHITGKEAAQIRTLSHLNHAKLWQINHILPREADLIKEGGTPLSREKAARQKEETLLKLNDAADHVFSVGPRMYSHFENKMVNSSRKSGEGHTQLILPLNPDFLEHKTNRTDFPDVGEESIQVLYFGRTDSVYFVKGMDIAMRTVEAVNLDETVLAGRRVELKVRGTNADMEADTAMKLIALQKENSRDIAPIVEGFASQEDIRRDLQQAHIVIMPSRSEPFGLVAMEAIACRVPTLVSRNSGIADLLTKHNHKDACVKTSAHHPDTLADASKYMDADVKHWAEAIVKLIGLRDRAFTQADDLTESLIKEIESPYSKIVALGEGRSEQTPEQ